MENPWWPGNGFNVNCPSTLVKSEILYYLLLSLLRLNILGNLKNAQDTRTKPTNIYNNINLYNYKIYINTIL